MLSSRSPVLAALVASIALSAVAPPGVATAGERPGARSAADTAIRVDVAAKVGLSEAIWERRILTLTNKRRAKAGCKPLKLSTTLRKAARKHSDLMAKHNTLSHQLPGEPSLGTRITQAGYRNWRGVGENVAYGYLTPADTMAAWMASPGHRANIVNCKYKHLGVGVTIKGLVPWSTQDFGRK